eukprot:TRINITY_DN3281_c0_g1_i2.p1 TRINITY_DN3281_c0_g1~~TRINITY_DN3281_c0_g1_i2.p1  ORF type:complete len:236 (+),score=26.23 TRINITY_DN3281_c0_g1_i2:57-764(+)
MASHLIKLLFSLPLLITLYISTVVLGCDFQAIFNFGDSNSDTGGLSATFVPVPPPNGQTFFRSPAGRNCDGRLLIDFMANGLGLPFLNAYLDSVGSNFTHGANFATSSSTVLQQNLSLFTGGYSPFSLDVQSWQFSQFKSRSKVAYQRGFQHPLKSCCGQGGKYNFNRYLRCGATEVINGTEILIVKSCKKPMQSISWDGVHFTEAANKWVLNQIVGGAFSDPPIPLKRACHKKA